MSETFLNTTLRKTKSFLEFLSTYHSHEIIGRENIPKSGPFIIINNHSLATYDGFLLGMEIFNDTGRLPKALGDDMLFKFPIIKRWCDRVGIMPASPKNAREILKNGDILALAPGGMIESLRASKERYELKWDGRKGFAKLALETETPIVLAACPAADKIFKVYDNFLTPFIYKQFKFPLPLFSRNRPNGDSTAY